MERAVCGCIVEKMPLKEVCKGSQFKSNSSNSSRPQRLQLPSKTSALETALPVCLEATTRLSPNLNGNSIVAPFTYRLNIFHL